MQFYKLLNNAQEEARLRAITEERNSWLDRKPFIDAKHQLKQLPDLEKGKVFADAAAVHIGTELSTDDPLRSQLHEAAQAMIPWKKGPFNLFGIDIDAEWRSDYKWDRFKDQLPSQENKTILDVGCNNAYYLFRLLPQHPRYMLGIDPVPRLWYQFHLLQHYAQIPNLEFQMWGWEEMNHWASLFDTIFCMGIIYHHRDPLGLLRNLRETLKPGGLLIMESIIIPGDDTICLFPDDRYAKMRNVWFVPTANALKNMLIRARFTDVEVVAVNRHEPAEQRTTPWNPGPSYEQFLDPQDPEKTIEGHPAPYRAILFARKRG